MKSSTVFSKCARKTGFAGTSTTRYRLLDAALLVVITSAPAKAGASM